ncbi:hypothetical protein CEXT_113372 [Caerostris extrusa]|uniref:Uncharacterized protein n=1 Tax=Caerostris extrusa TaxID=172846 RepID=A0AAV4MC23_CAEEX|nr:hypothetical protein CEXT_113372 [Caerostris extrusa]
MTGKSVQLSLQKCAKRHQCTSYGGINSARHAKCAKRHQCSSCGYTSSRSAGTMIKSSPYFIGKYAKCHHVLSASTVIGSPYIGKYAKRHQCPFCKYSIPIF